MAQLIKIGNVYYSDLRVACDGTDCPTKDKPRPHFHRRRKSLSTDKRFAEEKLADMVKIRGAIKRGEYINDISWQGFKDRFMVYVSSKDKTTQYAYEKAFEELENAFPITTLKSLTPERLEGFKGLLKDTCGKLTTANRKLIAIKTAINKAIEWKMLDYDIAYKKISLYKVPKGRRDYFSLEEMNELISHCKGIWKTICVLGYYTGMRRGEMLWLRKSSLDFVHNRVRVEPYEEFDTKNHLARTIPMHPKLRDYLEKTLNGSSFVLGDVRPSGNALSHGFIEQVKNAGFKGGIHKLRHTFASHCAMAGIDVVTLKNYMGHSSTKTTDIYMHLSPTHSDQQILRLPEA